MNAPLTLIYLNSLNQSFIDDKTTPKLPVSDFSSESLKSLTINSDWIAFLPELGNIPDDFPSCKIESLIPAHSQTGIIPLKKPDFLPTELKLIQVNLAVLITNPLSLGIPVIHKSVFHEALNENLFNPIQKAFVNQCFDEKAIELLEPLEGIVLSAGQSLPDLAPGYPPEELEWLRFKILNSPTGKLILQSDTSLETTAVRAGLLLFHDELDASHRCSQSREGEQLADHWHGIMHRREPDDSNSKYWYRRVGHSPIFEPLAEYADELLRNDSSSDMESWRQKLITGSNWDSFAFVDLCSFCRKSGNMELTQAAEKIQYMEMLLLLNESCISQC